MEHRGHGGVHCAGNFGRGIGNCACLFFKVTRRFGVGALRGALRWILWGLASMAFICTGLVFIVLGIVRASQDVLGDSFQQSWSFVSYFVGILACGVVVAIALSSIKKESL